jgi:transposase
MVEPIYKRCAGLDVHKKMIMATVLIEQPDGSLRKETFQFGVLPQDLIKLANWLKSQDVELTVMESTGVYWKSVFEALEAVSLNTYVVNARHVKQVPGRKTDVKDSEWLASLARFGLLKASFIPEKDLRELRTITRYRNKLIGMLASEKNRLNKVLDDGGMRLGNIVSDIGGVSATKIIDGLIAGQPLNTLLLELKGSLKKKSSAIREVLNAKLSERHIFTLEQIRSHIKYLQDRKASIEHYILRAMEPYDEQWKILQTIPGIDMVTAAIMIVETGVDMQRFEGRKHFCSWAGLCPGQNESAGKKKSSKTRKGNRQLRITLCQVSNAAIKTRGQFQDKYKSLLIRRGHKRAIVATGHKILRIVYSLLRTKKSYVDPVIDYKALIVKKNAPRWLKSLEKYGFLQKQNKADKNNTPIATLASV